MQLGLVLPHSESGIAPEVIRELSRSAEALGYHSLWTIESEKFPAAARQAVPSDRSARAAVRDPLAALALAATGTDHIRIGLSVVNVPFHSPLKLATSLAALDRLSNGRVRVGVGVGYSVQECLEVASTLHRDTPAAEFVAAFESLWRGSDAGFRGGYYFIPRGAVIPEPVQSPTPPISLVSFAPPAVLSADALVNGRALSEPVKPPRSEMAGLVRGICATAAQCPFGPGLTIRASVIVTAEALGPERAMFHGSPGQIQADIELARSHGATELMLDPGSIEGDADLTWTLSTMRMVREMVGVPGGALAASA